MVRSMNVHDPSVKKFLNMSSWDLCLSEELENGRLAGEVQSQRFVNLPDSCDAGPYLRTMSVPRPKYLSPTRISRDEAHLLRFCM